jgi:hypothetical protein
MTRRRALTGDESEVFANHPGERRQDNAYDYEHCRAGKRFFFKKALSGCCGSTWANAFAPM